MCSSDLPSAAAAPRRYDRLHGRHFALYGTGRAAGGRGRVGDHAVGADAQGRLHEQMSDAAELDLEVGLAEGLGAAGHVQAHGAHGEEGHGGALGREDGHIAVVELGLELANEGVGDRAGSDAALGTLAEQTGYVPDGTTLALANQIQILVTGLIGLWGAARARQPIIGD